jgi:endonuclease/exonuclease/phosphatase family metal-dependent hydrolase
MLSFNIHHAEGTDAVLDLDRVAGVIRSSGAGIVGLQELDRHHSERSNWLDEPTELARQLHMHVAFAASIDDPPPAAGQPRIQYGTATLNGFLTDSWTVAGYGPGYTIESGDPTRRIDYVFGTHGVHPLLDRIIDTDPTASDHLPVAATLRLTGSSGWVG